MRFLRFSFAVLRWLVCGFGGHQYRFHYLREEREIAQWPHKRTRGFVSVCGNCGMEAK